jgi:AraC-like DNA-binding protein
MIGKTRQLEKITLDEAFDPGLGGTKGILRWPPPVGKFRHLRRRPSPELTAWIDRYWMVAWDLADEKPFLQETLPFPVVHVTFEGGKCRVGGVCSGRFSRVLEGCSRVFGIKFRPGGFRPFLNSSVSAMKDRIVPGEKIFGKQIRKLEVLAETDCTEEEMIGSMDQFFLARRPEPDATVELASRLVRQISEDNQIKRVDDLVFRVGIGKRSLQRIFREYVGIHPKWVICRFRLHEVVERFVSGNDLDFSQLALEMGYFDQAHLINQFRSILGSSPAEYREQVLAMRRALASGQ